TSTSRPRARPASSSTRVLSSSRRRHQMTIRMIHPPCWSNGHCPLSASVERCFPARLFSEQRTTDKGLRTFLQQMFATDVDDEIPGQCGAAENETITHTGPIGGGQTDA